LRQASRPDGVKINGCCENLKKGEKEKKKYAVLHHLNVMDAELLTLSDTIPIDDNKRTTVEVKTPTITTELICVHVNATTFVGSSSNELDSNTEFSELMVATAGIAYDVDPIESEIDVRAAGRPQFLAHFAGDA
jgi:hypothetical protein